MRTKVKCPYYIFILQLKLKQYRLGYNIQQDQVWAIISET